MKKSDAPLHVKYLQTLVECLCMLGKVAAAGAIVWYVLVNIHFGYCLSLILNDSFHECKVVADNLFNCCIAHSTIFIAFFHPNLELFWGIGSLFFSFFYSYYFLFLIIFTGFTILLQKKYY